MALIFCKKSLETLRMVKSCQTDENGYILTTEGLNDLVLVALFIQCICIMIEFILCFFVDGPTAEMLQV